MTNGYTIVVREPEENMSFKGPRNRCEDKFKIGFKGICKRVNWISWLMICVSRKFL